MNKQTISPNVAVLLRWIAYRCSWIVRDTIRTSNRECPICAILNQTIGHDKYRIDAFTAGRELGFTDDEITPVMYAADNPDHPLRAELETLLGLHILGLS